MRTKTQRLQAQMVAFESTLREQRNVEKMLRAEIKRLAEAEAEASQRASAVRLELQGARYLWERERDELRAQLDARTHERDIAEQRLMMLLDKHLGRAARS